MTVYNNKKNAWIICIIITLIFCFYQLISAHNAQEITKLRGSEFNTPNHYTWESIDSMTYILYAQEPTKKWREHWNNNDNYPNGRANYYSSIPVFALKLSGAVYQAIENTFHHKITREEAIEKSAIIWNPLLVLVAGSLLSWMLLYKTAQPAIIGGLLYSFILFLPTRIRDFLPYYPHHRGLSTILIGAFLIFLFLSIKEKNKKYDYLAGAAVGIGMWVSLFNTIPYLIITAIATTGAYLLRNKNKALENIAPSWRRIGIVGFIASTIGWFAEYFPKIPLELEVSTPITGLLFLSGCFSVALVCNNSSLKEKLKSWDIIIVIAGIIPAILTYHIMGQESLSSTSPMVKACLWATSEIAIPKDPTFYQYGGLLLLLSVTLSYIVKKLGDTTELVFIFIASLGLILLGQTALRLIEPTTTLAAILLSLGVCTIISKLSQDIKILVLSFIFIVTVFSATKIFINLNSISEGREIPQTLSLYKQSAKKASFLNNWASQFKKSPIVLCDNISEGTALNYYSNKQNKIKTISSAYWENGDGLTSAGLILGNIDEDEAINNIKRKSITHIILDDVSKISPLLIGMYGNNIITQGPPPTSFMAVKWKSTPPAWLQKYNNSIYEVNFK